MIQRMTNRDLPFTQEFKLKDIPYVPHDERATARSLRFLELKLLSPSQCPYYESLASTRSSLALCSLCLAGWYKLGGYVKFVSVEARLHAG
jgi:hypothetical protein